MRKRNQLREAVFSYKEGEVRSLTQENLGMSLKTIIQRIQSGQQVPSGMPVYLEDKFPEIIGFEKLTNLEKIDFVRKFKEDTSKAALKSKEAYEAEIAKQLAAKDKIIESQKDESQQL